MPTTNTFRSSGEQLVSWVSAIGSWSGCEVRAMLNPFNRIERAVAIVVAAVAVAVRLWALVYRGLRYMAVNPRRGVFRKTTHPEAVARLAYAAFVAAVAVKCLAEGRSIAYVVWVSSIAAVGGVAGDRRARSAVLSAEG
jgi:hypothetical protein